MSVLDPAALEASPLADLHEIASELSIDSYRRLRKDELIEAILERSGAKPSRRRSSSRSSRAKTADKPEKTEAKSEKTAEKSEKPAPRAGGRSSAKPKAADADKTKAADEDKPNAADDPDEATDRRDADEDTDSSRRRRGRRGGRTRASEQPAAETSEDESGQSADEPVEGVVELLPNGSGFVRVNPPDPSDDDIYVSAAQVKRCELVSGDRISGPRRTPRRSERFASLVRIDSINGQPASELADGARFDDMPAAFPNERFRLGSEDPTVKAIEWLTPFGYGSRVVIVGGARSGKSEALRRTAQALTKLEGLQLSVVLAGVRPEEISEWGQEPVTPTAAVSFAASADAQDHTVELVIDQARRIAARGAHAVVLIDTLDGMHPHSARRAMSAARNLVDGGSLTVIATATEPIGGETTVITLNAALTSTGRFPAIDLTGSGTMKPELLVGEAGADAIATARAEALDE